MNSAERAREVVMIPGLRADPHEVSPLHQRLEEAGMTVHLVVPDWNRRGATFEDMARTVGEQIDTRGVGEDAVLLGHSFGAVLCCAEASRREYGRLVLCSLSPVSAAGMRLMQKRPEWPRIQAGLRLWGDTGWVAELGRLDSFIGRLEDARVPVNECQVFIGGNEQLLEAMRYQAAMAAAALSVRYSVIAEAPHDINHPVYTAVAVGAVTAPKMTTS